MDADEGDPDEPPIVAVLWLLVMNRAHLQWIFGVLGYSSFPYPREKWIDPAAMQAAVRMYAE